MTSVSEKPKANGSSISSRESTVIPEDVKKTVKDTVADVTEKVETKVVELGKVIKNNAPEVASIASDKASTSSVSPESPSPSPAPSKAKTQPVEIKSAKKETRSSSPPASSSFSPSLPSSLPSASSKQLPANRKRKQPQDFTPSGPGTPSGLTSPTKNGVKFEDGVAPGEGRDGERTIPVKKNQNVIERTVWTFIMIFGFIGLLCAGHPYMILLVMLCQALVYKEVTALFNLRDRELNS
jgi:phosphatidate cytidylyltransferase